VLGSTGELEVEVKRAYRGLTRMISGLSLLPCGGCFLRGVFGGCGRADFGWHSMEMVEKTLMFE